MVKQAEAWAKTGKPPILTKWVDTDKAHGMGVPMVRSRRAARDFKGPNERGREDQFSATPPTGLIRYMLSRQATRRPDGVERKTMYLDIKKAHPEARAGGLRRGASGGRCGGGRVREALSLVVWL